MTFAELVSLAREGRLSEARGVDPVVDTFLDRFGARLAPEDPVGTLLSCAAEDGGPLGAGATAWLAAAPEAPPHLRRRTRVGVEPGLVMRCDAELDPVAMDADADGDVIVVVDHGRWPDGHGVVVFDRRTRSSVHLRGDEKRWGTGVAVAPDGTWAVVTGGRRPHVVDLHTHTVTTLPKGHRSDVRCVAFTGPDTFVTGGEDGALHHWTRAGKKLASVPKAHPGYLGRLRVRGAELWSAAFDATVRVWRLPDLHPLRELTVAQDRQAVAFALDEEAAASLPAHRWGPAAADVAGGRLYTGTDAGLHVHDLATGELVGTRPGLRPTTLLFRAGHLFVVERYRPQLRVFRPTEVLAASPAGPALAATFLAASPDGSRVVVATDGNSGRLQVERGGRVHEGREFVLCDADGAVLAACPDTRSPFAFAGGLLVVGTSTGGVEARALGDGAVRWTVPGVWPDRMVKERFGRPCAASLDGALALVAGRSGDQEGIELRDPADGALRTEFGPWSEVRALFAEGGALWFSTERSVGRIDGDAITWEVAVASPVSLRVRGDGVFVAEGATIRHLAAADGADRGTWKGRFKKPLHCLAIDDGGRVWSGGGDGRLRVWDPARGVEVGQAEPAGGQPVWHVRAGRGLVVTTSGRWDCAVFDASTLRAVAEPWATLTEPDLDTVGELFPEGSYQSTLTVHHLPTGRVARWVADRANVTTTAVGDRVWLAGRTSPGPVEVLEWVEGR